MKKIITVTLAALAVAILPAPSPVEAEPVPIEASIAAPAAAPAVALPAANWPAPRGCAAWNSSTTGYVWCWDTSRSSIFWGRVTCYRPWIPWIRPSHSYTTSTNLGYTSRNEIKSARCDRGYSVSAVTVRTA